MHSRPKVLFLFSLQMKLFHSFEPQKWSLCTSIVDRYQMWINKGNIHFRNEELQQEQESNVEESPEDNYGGQEVYREYNALWDGLGVEPPKLERKKRH